jgi:hypothetical protein
MAITEAIKELEQKLFTLHPEAEGVYTLINGLKKHIPADKKNRSIAPNQNYKVSI